MSDDYQIGDVIAGVPFGIGVAKITAICSGDDSGHDDGGDAHEPLACVGEHFPASWGARPSHFGAIDAASYDEKTRLRVENDAMHASLVSATAQNEALRAEVGGLRLRIAAMELSYRAALADAKPARVVSPLHRALTVRPGAFGLHTGLEG